MSKNKSIIIGFCAITILLPVLDVHAIGDVEFNDTIHTQLEEVHVKGVKPSNGVKSAVPEHTITSTRILKSGISDLTEALHRIPGLQIRDYGGTGSQKTVSARGLGAQHTGVMYDGVSLSDLQSGKIDLSRYSIDKLSSISFNMGDADNIFQSARMSASASTLIINTLLDPHLYNKKSNLNVGFTVGSFQTYSPSFYFSKSNGNNLAGSFSVDFLHALNNFPFTLYNGDLHTRENRKNSLINQSQAEIGLVWKATDRHKFRFKFYYYDNYKQLPGPVIYYAAPSNQRLKERNFFGQLSYSGKISESFSVNGIAKYNWGSTFYKDTDGRYPGGELADYYIQNEEYLSATLLYRSPIGISASYAADYFHNFLTDNKSINSRPKRDSFLQCFALRYELGRFKMSARALWSIVTDKSQKGEIGNSDKLSPSASLSLRLLNEGNFYARMSYKNIFRMPTFNELYFDHYGSINLKPEITDQYNFGLTYSMSHKLIFESLELTIDGFLNNITNKIIAVPYNMFLWTMTNMGKARSFGIDATLNTSVNISTRHQLSICGNYSYNRAASRSNRDSSDWNKQLPYIPLNSGAWSICWLNPWVNFVINGNGSSARYSTASNLAETKIGGYMTLGLSFYRNFVFKSSSWQVKLDIINLLDHQYEIVRRYPMPGRSVKLSLNYKLN